MKTDNEKFEEFGLFVTSNASLSHLLFGDRTVTPCGLDSSIFNADHHNSETRWYEKANKFHKWITEQRKMLEPGYRLCFKCVKAYDKWHQSIEPPK